MTQAVIDVALAVAAVNALPAVVGAVRWYQGGQSRMFWVLLRVGEVCALLLALFAGVLAAAGHYSSDRLFYLYAVLPVVVAFFAEQLRLTSAATVLEQRGLEDARAVGALPEGEQLAVVEAIVRREMGIMALSTVVVVFLALRAAGTAHGF